MSSRSVVYMYDLCSWFLFSFLSPVKKGRKLQLVHVINDVIRPETYCLRVCVFLWRIKKRECCALINPTDRWRNGGKTERMNDWNFWPGSVREGKITRNTQQAQQWTFSISPSNGLDASRVDRHPTSAASLHTFCFSVDRACAYVIVHTPPSPTILLASNPAPPGSLSYWVAMGKATQYG